MPLGIHPPYWYGSVEAPPADDDDDKECSSLPPPDAEGARSVAAIAVAVAGLALWVLVIFAGGELWYDLAPSAAAEDAAAAPPKGRDVLSPELTLYEDILPLPAEVDEEAEAEPKAKAKKSARSSWRGEELWYHDQLVDHSATDGRCVDDDKIHLYKAKKPQTWSHRYFSGGERFRGPGHPIFLIIGGEADDTPGLLYKFVVEDLAGTFGAYVIQPEHRFYGKSQPKGKKGAATLQDFKDLLRVEQVVADIVRLAGHVRKELGCSPSKSSPGYCPVIAVGGSYPALLTVLLRVSHPDVVDAAYASSVPLLGLTGFMASGTYYDHITEVADSASPGCAAAVKSTLLEMVHTLSSSEGGEKESTFQDVAGAMGLCVDTLPEYLTTDAALFGEEMTMLAGNIFAEYDMDYYPPTDDTTFVRACKVFQDDSLTTMGKMRSFFLAYAKDDEEGDYGIDDHDEDAAPPTCFDLSTMIPDGPHGTISSSDWSGAGGGNDGNVWDFQCCYQLTTNIGFSERSMFPERPWSLDWVIDHCLHRFGVIPELGSLANEYGVWDLVAGRGASRILFTNGMNDGWSVCGSVTEDLSGTILALNFPNGTHHSDLSYRGPVDGMTDDIREGRVRVAEILGGWLGDIKTKGE